MATSTLKRKTAPARSNGHVEASAYDDIAFRIPADAFHLIGVCAWPLSDDFPENANLMRLVSRVNLFPPRAR
jgi:hypothetical protein